MKKGKKSMVIMDYTTIIIAFLTFIISLIIFYTYSYRVESNLYLIMMAINAAFIFIGFKNLSSDKKQGLK